MMVKGGRSGRRRMKNVGKPFVMVLAIVGIAQGQQVRLRSTISFSFAV